jgi:hypothetical protein
MDAAGVEKLWEDFCHYVVIARPDLAASYGRRLLIEATPEQLGSLLGRTDATTVRAVRLLDERRVSASFDHLGEVWVEIRSRSSTASKAGS